MSPFAGLTSTRHYREPIAVAHLFARFFAAFPLAFSGARKLIRWATDAKRFAISGPLGCAGCCWSRQLPSHAGAQGAAEPDIALV